MILFRCASCGQAYRVDDQYRGGSAECQACNARVDIPQESDAGVFLVYRAGDSEQGQPLVQEEVERRYTAGELVGTDLVWRDGAWYPLADLFEEKPAELVLPSTDKGGLRLHLSETEDKGEDLIDRLPAIVVQAAASASGGPVPAPAPAPTSAAGGGGWRFWRRRPAAAAPVGPRAKVVVALQSLAGVLAVWYGYRFGVGPLISDLVLKKQTLVIVLNHENTGYTARLGWRRLTQELGPKAPCQFELHVSPWPVESQTLTLIPAEPGQPSLKISVPLRPGVITLVNPYRKGTYAILDPAEAAKISLAGPAKALASQIGQHKEPGAGAEVAAKLVQACKQSLKGTTNEVLFDNRRYHLISFEGGTQGATLKVGKPILVTGASCRLDVPEGWNLFDQGNPGRLEGVVRLPATTVKLPKGLTVQIPAGRDLAVRREGGNRLVLSTDIQNQALKHEGGSYNGTWQYRATQAPGKDGKNAWSWSWSYQGFGQDKDKKTQSLRIQVPQTGDPTAKLG